MRCHVPTPANDVALESAGLRALQRALRDMKVSMKRPADTPYRDQMLVVLADARVRIDRINGAA